MNELDEPILRGTVVHTINNQGWTCTMHEPSSPGMCPDCATNQTKLAEAVIDTIRSYQAATNNQLEGQPL